MRLKMLMATLAGLFAFGPALAQDAAPAAPTTPAAPAAAPAPAVDPANILDLELSTGGTVKILLRPDKAPHSVERIRSLANRGFYDGLVFHRVIEGFMAQTGDPRGDGTGGSDLPDLKAEFNDMPHVRGVMSMARADNPDSANSQFFIMLTANLRLDGKYTAIGRVISGMQYVDAIERGEPPANPSKIVRARTEAAEPTLPVAAAATAADPHAHEREEEAAKAVKSVLKGEMKDDQKPKK
ncbi:MULTISPECIES: peptidylprolyl isomerase [Sphingomonadales]|uniref:Peptidyl-prolyl cis-trans isomerase n=1 Tax=Edaphosphingomonas haloaromaticamans TaxID=653954 RepID=A0A1S1H8J8_9SPHN|nr:MULTISPECIES: peptidylprolyl isomerase [Sphingomonas]AGH50239.1 cyclophilin type peptidyl-prolyl cis-trans isomerase [Sphingomonas sp. MM-1]OHT18529.1 putative peptidyl-prolyl cis-trans isomerase [Sphingomonas haloaromaticamans]